MERVSVYNGELRAIIRFFTLKGKTGTEIYNELATVYGAKCLSVQKVRKWRESFLNGRVNVKDEHRNGRPSKARTGEVFDAVKGSTKIVASRSTKSTKNFLQQ